MQAHPLRVEVEKDAFEKGKYQHPELYGLPKEVGIDYDYRVERSRAMMAKASAKTIRTRK